eukprot:scpid59693/ scgid13769/ 
MDTRHHSILLAVLSCGGGASAPTVDTGLTLLPWGNNGCFFQENILTQSPLKHPFPPSCPCVHQKASAAIAAVSPLSPLSGSWRWRQRCWGILLLLHSMPCRCSTDDLFTNPYGGGGGIGGAGGRTPAGLKIAIAMPLLSSPLTYM